MNSLLLLPCHPLRGVGTPPAITIPGDWRAADGRPSINYSKSVGSQNKSSYFLVIRRLSLEFYDFIIYTKGHARVVVGDGDGWAAPTTAAVRERECADGPEPKINYYNFPSAASRQHGQDEDRQPASRQFSVKCLART